MKKITWFCISLMLICLMLTACRENSAPSESDVSVASLSSTEAVPSGSEISEVDSSLSEISSGKAETEKDTTSNLTSDTPHLVWAVGLSPYIDAKARAEIISFLHKNGIDCEIDFVDVEGGETYRTWYEQQKQNGTPPDIMAVAPWQYGIYDAVDFITAEVLPLDDYLKTETGKRLQDSYCDIEWKQVTIDGKIYTVPKRMRQRSYDQYIYVNDRDKNAFEESFDGSYESLRQICEGSTAERPIIGSDSLGSARLCPFLGFICRNSLFYDTASKTFDDLCGEDRLKDLLLDVHSDMMTGRFVSWASSDILADDVFAYITDKQLNGSAAGYTRYVLSPYVFTIDSGAFGVCAFSSKQELALQVLGACFSDPEIASLIGYGEVSVEEWDKETEMIKTYTPDILTGFLPELSKEEIEKLNRKYLKDVETSGKMITSKDPISGIGFVNPNFPEVWENYSADMEDISEIYDKINQQLKEWTKNHDY
ncbi:MAG: hypothetical protein IK125_00600 [Lachnospiraceae bacterium]|nr:hypothetical protein [Lachnospiraceae bacterium]